MEYNATHESASIYLQTQKLKAPKERSNDQKRKWEQNLYRSKKINGKLANNPKKRKPKWPLVFARIYALGHTVVKETNNNFNFQNPNKKHTYSCT